MSAFPMSSFSSWFFLILQIQFLSFTGPKISLIFSAQIFLNVVHFDLLTSRPHISMLLQVLLRLYIFLVLSKKIIRRKRLNIDITVYDIYTHGLIVRCGEVE